MKLTIETTDKCNDKAREGLRAWAKAMMNTNEAKSGMVNVNLIEA